MKTKKIFLLLLSCSFLVACTTSKGDGSSGEGGDNPSGDTSTSEGEGGSGESYTSGKDTPEVVVSTNIQDANILHAWNWKMTDITSRLDAIKNAGYEAIQISPMQPKVDKTDWANESTAGQWWKLYQPLDFKVAGNGENFLGTKSELTYLCSAAKAKGIKIVADVVCNHLAGDGGGYNGQVYTKYPRHSYNSGADDNNGESVVKGHIGLPDVDTSTSQVQNAVLGMLKEYVDCGVTGFRFDAAKHIETPDDPSAYRSDFWTTVLNGTTQYAESKGYDKPYYYGEVLNTPGAGRSWESYTKLMSICENKQGSSTVSAIKNSNSSNMPSGYPTTGANPDHLVLWAESHDTYANTSGYELTTSYPTEVINRAYIIQASRKDAATLYFARPTSREVRICSIDDNSGWKNPEIKAINDFHTHYLQKSEHVTITNDYFVNIRGTGTIAGAAIVKINGGDTATVNVTGLQDGEYTDMISNNTFTVSNGSVNVTYTSGACILVPKGTDTNPPSEDSSSSSTPVTPTNYNSQVVITNQTAGSYYYAWVFGGSGSDKFVRLNDDHGGLGFNMDGYTSFTIVEMSSDSGDWNNKIKQTVDHTFTSEAVNGKIILDWSTTQMKS